MVSKSKAVSKLVDDDDDGDDDDDDMESLVAGKKNRIFCSQFHWFLS